MNKEIKQRIEQLNNGKIPKGYKKTDFGVFPSDWETDKTLGDLFDFYGGLSKSRDELGEEGYAYLHYGDLHRGTFNTVSIDHYEQLPKCDISLTGKEKCLMKDGDVAFLDASEDLEGTSRAVLIDNPENKPFIAGLHIIYGKAKNNSLDKWFKQYITSSESVKKQFQRLSVGFKVYGVNRDTIPRIRVSFPSSLKEQSRIAEILMKWDKAIELYDKQIDALTRYKAVCLRKMFPAKGQNVPEWRFQGFTGAWEQRKLGEICQVTMGQSPDGSTYSETPSDYILVQGNADLKDGWVFPRIWTTQKTKTAEAGDLIMSVRAPAGAMGKTSYNVVLGRGVAGIKGNEFIYQSLVKMDSDGYWKKLAAGSTFESINSDVVNGAELVVPQDIAEQNKIGEYFSSIDHLITLHQRKKETIINQRKTLQQYLLNGIVRVKS